MGLFIGPMRSLILIFAAVFALVSLDAAAQQSKRARVQDVSKAVRGEEDVPTGPAGIPRPPKSEDGRDYVYLDAVYVTAIRERRAARTYTMWPRVTVPEDGRATDIDRAEHRIRDALVAALTEVAQIDWPGPSKIDLGVASELAKARVVAVLGKGKVDALDFIHVEVQLF